MVGVWPVLNKRLPVGNSKNKLGGSHWNICWIDTLERKVEGSTKKFKLLKRFRKPEKTYCTTVHCTVMQAAVTQPTNNKAISEKRCECLEF